MKAESTTIAPGSTSIPNSGARPVPTGSPAPAAPAAPPEPSAPAAPEKPPKTPSIFDEVDAMTEVEPKPKPAEVKPPEPPAAPAAEPKPGERQFSGPKELRDHAKRLENENKSLNAKIAEAEKKILEAEESGKSTKALTERLAALEQQLKDRESRLYQLDVEQSPEFVAKFNKPFDKAAEFAKRQVEGLELTEVGADGETQGTRAATFEDFVALYKMPFNKAVKAANAVFGEAAQMVINHITELQRLDYQRQEALTEARETAVTKRKEEEDTRVAEASKHREAISAMWTDVNKDLSNRNPELQADPKDPKEAEILNKSFQLVDSSYGERKEQTLQQRVVLDAEIRHRAAREPLLRYRNKKLQNEVEELKGIIEEMKGGKPGSVQNPGNHPPEKKEKSLMDDLESAEF